MNVAVRERTLALARPLETAHGPIEERTVFLVRLERDGQAGIGEAAPLPGWTEPVDDCRESLETATARLREGDARGALDVVEDAPAAGHGLRLATDDRSARVHEEPLYEQLGGFRRIEALPVNATIGDTDPETSARLAEAAVDAGFETLKLKAGARSVSEDLARVRAVRAAVGDEITLRVDANAAWSQDEASEAFGDLRQYGVTYVEQPLAPDELDGLRALRGGGVGVAVDETLLAHDLQTVIDARAADAAIIKPMVHGGPAAAVRLARLARNNGLDPVITTTIDGVVARTAAVHVAAALPVTNASGLATATLLAADLAPDPALVADGAIAVPQTPGTGLRVDADSALGEVFAGD